VNALHPGGVLLAQVPEQLQPGAHLQHLFRRDPRLRQPPAGKQLVQVPSVGAVGLRAPFGPRAAAVSAGSARCASTPARCNSSTTNRHPGAARTGWTSGPAALQPDGSTTWSRSRISFPLHPLLDGRVRLPGVAGVGRPPAEEDAGVVVKVELGQQRGRYSDPVQQPARLVHQKNAAYPSSAAVPSARGQQRETLCRPVLSRSVTPVPSDDDVALVVRHGGHRCSRVPAHAGPRCPEDGPARLPSGGGVSRRPTGYRARSAAS
jgi:hypothetical protein